MLARGRRQLLQGSLALAGPRVLAGRKLLAPPAERPARIPRAGYLSGGWGQECADAVRQVLACGIRTPGGIPP